MKSLILFIVVAKAFCCTVLETDSLVGFELREDYTTDTESLLESEESVPSVIELKLSDE